MLGLWEKPSNEIENRHFAFQTDKDYILNEASLHLKQFGIETYNSLKDGTNNPMVFVWMPALAIYFRDPDGHFLEFISVLEGESKPELGIISYEEWLALPEE